MPLLKEFNRPAPKPLPIFLLADTSGSMRDDGKIEAMNQSVRDMLDRFQQEPEGQVELQVCVVVFGGKQARIHLPLQAARKITWSDMQAGGETPLGQALRVAAELIEDEKTVPSRAFRPVVVLVSDGLPGDNWRDPLQRLVGGERTSKADRFALAIGGDADENMLQEFLANPGRRVFHAEDARRIRDFFDLLTMSVTARSRSDNPNLPPPGDPFDLQSL